MRRFILIAPDLHDRSGEISVIRSEMPCLPRFRDHGTVSMVRYSEGHGNLEAEYLGLERNSVSMQQGPLTAAALGYDPPDRSAHYHLSLLSTTNGLIDVPKVQLDSETQRLILDLAKKLNTRRITFCEGEGSEHALVIESGSPESETTPPDQAIGKAVQAVLPNCEDEQDLRRFIDDSINLLSEQEFNLRRIDNELPPINLLWPWGGGWRHHVQNLGLRFGEVGYVCSNSIRLQGLTRLAGWKHCSRSEFREGTRINFEFLLNWVRANELSICLLSEFSEFRASERFEELAWLASEMNRRLLIPLYEDSLEHEIQVSFVSPSSQTGTSGIAMKSRSGKVAHGIAPFDERLLDEKRIPTFSIAESVHRSMVETE